MHFVVFVFGRKEISRYLLENLELVKYIFFLIKKMSTITFIEERKIKIFILSLSQYSITRKVDYDNVRSAKYVAFPLYYTRNV